MNKKSLKLSGIMLVGVIIIVSFVYAINIQPVVFGNPFDNRDYIELKNFNSYDELVDFLSQNCRSNYGYDSCCETILPFFNTDKSGVSRNIVMADSDEGGSYVDFSKTNIQVDGVDEPDIVKTDGKYLYIVVDSKIFIIKAYPAEDATVISEISQEKDVYVSNIFINDDRLVVFGTSTRYPIDYEPKDEYRSYLWDVSTTIINIYDVSDIENPKLVQDIEIDGSYFDSRMIGEHIYVIATEYSGIIYQVLEDNEILNISEITVNNVTKKLPANHIYYVDVPEKIDTMTHVISINLYNDEVSQKSFLLDSSQTMYVSKNNIFLTYTHYEYFDPNPIIGSPYRKSIGITIIHKISVNGGEITYIAQGEVPGRILNQFSMDEYDGFLRIATNIGNMWDNDIKSCNNIYILNEDLEHISKIEDIAPGERIYSARFMGGKAYLVTFKKVDPLFTIDLSDPHNPKILGKLKIPGYSDYLHPYDENHIIGIGKNTVEALDSLKESRGIDFAWYQGLKIALFDVSDFEKPKELAKIIIGDRGTDSPALFDHKAFLFNKEKELLVIPVNLYEISDEIKDINNGYTGNIYGDFKFQGVYVYKLNLDGFEYKGRITHMDDGDFTKLGYYGYYGSKTVKRSLYIDNVLYTISDSMIKMNSLDDLSEINSVELI